MKQLYDVEILNPKTSYEIAKVTGKTPERVGDVVIDFATETKQGVLTQSLIQVLLMNAAEHLNIDVKSITVDDIKQVKKFIVSVLKTK